MVKPSVCFLAPAVVKVVEVEQIIGLYCDILTNILVERVFESAMQGMENSSVNNVRKGHYASREGRTRPRLCSWLAKVWVRGPSLAAIMLVCCW